jgi:hypothetical protein
MIAQAASRAGGLSLDVNAKGFFALGNALLDASIATWNTKVVQDTVRPITYIRWLYKGGGSRAGAVPAAPRSSPSTGPTGSSTRNPT